MFKWALGYGLEVYNWVDPLSPFFVQFLIEFYKSIYKNATLKIIIYPKRKYSIISKKTKINKEVIVGLRINKLNKEILDGFLFMDVAALTFMQVSQVHFHIFRS